MWAAIQPAEKLASLTTTSDGRSVRGQLGITRWGSDRNRLRAPPRLPWPPPSGASRPRPRLATPAAAPLASPAEQRRQRRPRVAVQRDRRAERSPQLARVDVEVDRRLRRERQRPVVAGVLADLAAAPEHDVRAARQLQRRGRAQRVQHAGGEAARSRRSTPFPVKLVDDHRVDAARPAPPAPRWRASRARRRRRRSAAARPRSVARPPPRCRPRPRPAGTPAPALYRSSASVVGVARRHSASSTSCGTTSATGPGAAARRDAERGPHQVRAASRRSGRPASPS